MGLGPTWNSDSGSISESSIDIACAAAGELLEALQRGELATDGWTDVALGEAWVESALSDCLSRLASTGLWGRDNEVPSNAFWKIAGETLSVGRLQHRARTKPLGYAGDHEMLTWIYEDAVCGDPLGRLFDRYFLNQAAPIAVCNRTEQVAGEIARHCLTTAAEGEPYRIVSVGAGPGLDVELAARLLPEARRSDLDVTLLDLDEKGLAFAKERIGSVIDLTQVVCLRENLFRLAKRSSIVPHKCETDILICTGLFDYLEEDAAAAMLAAFWNQLGPGGKMLIGNFAPQCATRAYMEWIGNWYLIYRDAKQMAAIATKAELPAGSWSVGTERTGTNIFLTATRD